MTPLQAAPRWLIRSLVFDLDGLLIDSEPVFEEAARRLLARRGKQMKIDVMRRMMGTPGREGLPIFCVEHGLSEPLEEIGAEYRHHFFEIVGAEPLRLMPGAMELLDRLQERGLPLAIATSSTAAYVERVLTPHRILHRFRFVLTADDVQHGKPHPEIYQKAAVRFGVSPPEILVLEDSVNGLRSAKAAGARCIVVPHALVNVDELDGADAIVARLDSDELLDVLQCSRE